MSRRLTDEELLAKMKTHFQERKALYDALADNLADSYAEAATDSEYVKEQSEWVGSDRVIANSGVESLQTAGSVEKTMSSDGAIFHHARMARFQDDLEDVFWELMMNNNVERKHVLRMVDEALGNVEYQIEAANE